MCEIFNKRHERKIALSTADCKAICLMVKQPASVPRQAAQKKPALFLPQMHRYRDVNEQNPDFWKTQNWSIAAEMQEFFNRGRNHCQMGSYGSLHSGMFKSQNVLKILFPEEAFFFTSLKPSDFKEWLTGIHTVRWKAHKSVHLHVKLNSLLISLLPNQ